MRRAALSPGGIVLGLAILQIHDAGCRKPEERPSMAPLWMVHVDEVLPSMEEEFARLNIAENQGIHAILREHEQPIPPVYEIATTGGVFMSLRPKLSFTDLDAPSTFPESVSKLFSTVTDSLDGPIHAALKHHHNEIWRFHKSDSYFPATPGYRLSTPGYIQIVSERVIPRMGARYDELLESLNSALEKSSYPWGVLTFASSYGDGSYKYLWQADSKEELLKAGDRAAVLTAVYGRETADKMLADWQSCLAGSETVDAVPRRDFTDLDSSVGWLGLQQR